MIARTLLLSLTLITTHALAAPLPPSPRKVKETARSGPVTVAELLRVNYLSWGGRPYEIGFDRSGNYWSLLRYEDGSYSMWAGPWRMEGDTVIVEESFYTGTPDSAPEYHNGPSEYHLKLRCEKGIIVGEGWNDTVRMEKR